MMKKIFGLCPFIISLLFVNCHNEPYEGDIIIENNSCALAIQTTNEAGNNYLLSTGDNSLLLCQIFRDALEDQIEICGDENGTLQSAINQLGDCSNGNDLCNTAITATELAQINYQSANNDNFETLCSEYKIALQNQINVCGDDDALQALIDELGNCEFHDDVCQKAIEATSIAEEAYNNATEDGFEALCNTYKNVLMNQIEVCGDEDGVLQLIIDQLGECVPEDIVPIEGVWVLNFILVSSQLDIDNDEQETINIYAEMDCHETETVEFYDDGTGEFYRSTVANYSYINNSGSADGVDYIVSCSEINTAISFDWIRVNNDIFATLTDGTMLSFLKSPSVLSLIIPNGFSANNVDNVSPSISHDISYVYYKE
jgi:hypothetical protein